MYYFLVSLNILRSEAAFGHLKILGRWKLFEFGGHTNSGIFNFVMSSWYKLFIKFQWCPPNPNRFHYPYFVTRCNGPDRYVIYENSFRVEAERIAYVLVFVCLDHNFKYKCISIYRGFLPYATFGTWKKSHQPKIALANFLFYVRSNKINSP